MSTLERQRNSSAHPSVVHCESVSRKSNRNKCMCCRKLCTLMCSNFGLLALVIGYTYFGALIFRHLEAPHENNVNDNVISMRNMTIVRLWTITDKFNVIYKKNWTIMVTDEIMNFQHQLMQAVKEGYDGRDAIVGQPQKWSLSNAFFYSLTVITTIGYGNIAPKTNEGKVATVIYAIIGIPIMVIFLANSGHFLANCARSVFRQCCANSSHQVKKARVDSNSYASSAAEMHHAQHHVPNNYHVHHIALNEIGQNQYSNAMYHCNSNNHCCTSCDHQKYIVSSPECNQYLPQTNTETVVDLNGKLCSGGCSLDDHKCTATLPRAGHVYSIPKGTFVHNDLCKSQSIENSSPPDENHFGQLSLSSSRSIAVPMIKCSLLICGYICLGAVYLYRIEGWTLLDGGYFCFLALSTISFGGLTSDYSMQFTRTAYYERKLMIFGCYVLTGMILIAMCFNLLQDKIAIRVRNCKHNYNAKDEDGYREEEAVTDLQQTAKLVENNDDFDA